MMKEKGRFILVIGIVALISYLVYFLTGLAYGLAKGNTTAVEDWQAHAIVLSSGANGNVFSSRIPLDDVSDFESSDISYLKMARGVGYLNGKEEEDSTINLILMGLDQEQTAYPEVTEGKMPHADFEVLVSSNMKEEESLEIGDTIVLSANDEAYTVVGFANDTKFNVAPIVYLDLEDPAFATPMPGAVPANNAPSSTISGMIIHDETLVVDQENLQQFSIEDFIQEIPGFTAQVLTFGLMIGFLVLISSIVLGVFMYILTIQKKNTFGIMKVQGISNGYISKSVVVQTLLVSLIGTLIGFVATMLTERTLPVVVPFLSNYPFYAVITLSILVTALLGALFSVRAVTKVDPLEVLE